MTEPLHLRTTRAAYDNVTDLYADLFREGVADRPLDRALLIAFPELVRGAGPVADLGCGPGHVTAPTEIFRKTGALRLILIGQLSKCFCGHLLRPCRIGFYIPD